LSRTATAANSSGAVPAGARHGRAGRGKKHLKIGLPNLAQLPQFGEKCNFLDSFRRGAGRRDIWAALFFSTSGCEERGVWGVVVLKKPM
jgi:hypothetical protein